jgi:predicted  nucleic acid-binding Zn-ribbon protein
MSKAGSKPRISPQFLKDVSDKLNIISTLSKDSGVEVPNELEETLKELSISSARKSPQPESSNSSLISDEPKHSFLEIPAPSDSSPINSSMDSPSIKQLKSNNNLLCKAVKEKLMEFRSLNKQSRNQGAKATQELKTYQNELKDMKSSVIEIIDEANSTKEQIIKMKEKLEVELREPDSVKFEEYDMSTYRPGAQDSSNMLMEQIKDLHQEIYRIQNRIEKSEQDLRQKELENKELKVIIERLNESFDKIGSDNEEPSSSCQHCGVF